MSEYSCEGLFDYCREELTEGKVKFVGSDIILGLLTGPPSNEGYLERFKTTGFMAVTQTTTVSLSQAVEAADSYIAACLHPDSERLDTACEYIKEHVHLATISREQGFQWLPDFPLASKT